MIFKTKAFKVIGLVVLGMLVSFVLLKVFPGIGEFLSGGTNGSGITNKNTNKNTNGNISNTNITPDTTKPTVTISYPLNQAKISGKIVFTVTAEDNDRVESVQFKLGDNDIGEKVTASPFSFEWDTKNAEGGQYVISAEATDASGNKGISPNIVVTIDNSMIPKTPTPMPTSTLIPTPTPTPTLKASEIIDEAQKILESGAESPLTQAWRDIGIGEGVSTNDKGEARLTFEGCYIMHVYKGSGVWASYCSQEESKTNPVCLFEGVLSLWDNNCKNKGLITETGGARYIRHATWYVLGYSQKTGISTAIVLKSPNEKIDPTKVNLEMQPFDKNGKIDVSKSVPLKPDEGRIMQFDPENVKGGKPAECASVDFNKPFKITDKYSEVEKFYTCIEASGIKLQENIESILEQYKEDTNSTTINRDRGGTVQDRSIVMPVRPPTLSCSQADSTSGACKEIAPQSVEINFQSVNLNELASKEVRIANKSLIEINPIIKPEDITISGAAWQDFFVEKDCPKILANASKREADVDPRSCTIGINFSPTARGTRTALLTIKHNADSTDLKINLNGYGLNPGERGEQDLILSKRESNFGNVQLNTPKKDEFTIANILTTRTTELKFQIEGVNKDDFKPIKKCEKISNQICKVAVEFIPQALGERTATLVINHNAQPNGKLLFPLSGNAVDLSSAVSVSGTSIKDGKRIVLQPQEIGTSSTEREIVLNVYGDYSATVGQITINRNYLFTSDGCSRKIIRKNNPCKFGIIFNPKVANPPPGKLEILVQISPMNDFSSLDDNLTGSFVYVVDLIPLRFSQSEICITRAGKKVKASSKEPRSTRVFEIEKNGDVGGTITDVKFYDDNNQQDESINFIKAEPQKCEPKKCLVTVGFTPRKKDVRKGTLVIYYSSLSEPIRVPVSGVGSHRIWFSRVYYNRKYKDRCPQPK